MTIKEIVTLVGSGMKFEQIKELLAYTQPEEKPEDETENKPEDEPEDKPEEKPADYKKLYEETKQKLEQAQKLNLTRDASDKNEQKTDEELLMELFS